MNPKINMGTFALPPTGGDNEWVETDCLAICTACGADFEVRASYSIDGRDFVTLITSPFPEKASIIAFAVALITHYSGDLQDYIDICALFATLAEAENHLSNHPLTAPLNGKTQTVVKITSQGYWDKNNKLLPNAFEGVLRFLQSS
jgi:hypothetical protein